MKLARAIKYLLPILLAVMVAWHLLRTWNELETEQTGNIDHPEFRGKHHPATDKLVPCTGSSRTTPVEPVTSVGTVDQTSTTTKSLPPKNSLQASLSSGMQQKTSVGTMQPSIRSSGVVNSTIVQRSAGTEQSRVVTSGGITHPPIRSSGVLNSSISDAQGSARSGQVPAGNAIPSAPGSKSDDSSGTADPSVGVSAREDPRPTEQLMLTGKGSPFTPEEDEYRLRNGGQDFNQKSISDGIISNQ